MHSLQACVLACINDQPEVEDYEAICGDALEDVATCLREKCDGDLSKPALEHYVSVCGDAGIDVGMLILLLQLGCGRE